MKLYALYTQFKALPYEAQLDALGYAFGGPLMDLEGWTDAKSRPNYSAAKYFYDNFKKGIDYVSPLLTCQKHELQFSASAKGCPLCLRETAKAKESCPKCHATSSSLITNFVDTDGLIRPNASVNSRKAVKHCPDCGWRKEERISYFCPDCSMPTFSSPGSCACGWKEAKTEVIMEPDGSATATPKFTVEEVIATLAKQFGGLWRYSNVPAVGLKIYDIVESTLGVADQLIVDSKIPFFWQTEVVQQESCEEFRKQVFGLPMDNNTPFVIDKPFHLSKKLLDEARSFYADQSSPAIKPAKSPEQIAHETALDELAPPPPAPDLANPYDYVDPNFAPPPVKDWYPSSVPSATINLNLDKEMTSKIVGQAFNASGPVGNNFEVHSTGAIRSTEANDVRFDLIPQRMLERVAKVMKNGAVKYGEHNWTKGFKWSVCINHLARHLYLYLTGDKTEDHLAHMVCNLGFLIEFETTHPELNDIPVRKS